MLIDTHTHIADAEFDRDRDAVIERALASDVRRMILIGTGLESSRRAVALAERHPFLWATVGLHPHESKKLDNHLIKMLAQLADHPKVVGWGETGLDFYYNHATYDTQVFAFTQQIRLAKEKRLPLVIHTRDAWDETFDILTKEGIKEHAATYGAVLHCFTGNRKIAERATDLGLYVSFSGIMTFKKADEIREAAAAIDLNKIVIETDAPYLTPEGFRGKRNEPAYVRRIAERLAEVRHLSFAEVSKATSKNAERLFPRILS
ncbi:MAG: TatD family hydrolase [Nitrospiria bacterium]